MERFPRRAKRVAYENLFQADENSSSESDEDCPVSAIDDAIDLEQHGGTSSINESFEDITDARTTDDVMSDSQLVAILSENSASDSDLGDLAAEADSNDDQAVLQSFTSANGTLWNRVDHVNRAGRERSRNICIINVGFKRGLHPTSRKESFDVFFNEIVEIAHMFSNKYGKRLALSAGKPWKPISRLEIEAFIGLHLIAGSYKAGHRNTEELWSETDGHPFFRATMSFERFKFIKSILRFDDTVRRDKNDPLAPIRTAIDLFNKNVQAVYIPGPHLTLDEQLIEFHGRVKFRRYIPTKPGKYGLLMYWITDAETSIPVNGLLYIGQTTLSASDLEQGGSFSEALSLKLSLPFLGKGRNVVMDNYFTSLALAEKLAERNTTIVGTIRSNRRELPPAAKALDGRQRGDTVHYKSGDSILCSFWDKRNKPVLLISSMHPGETYRLEGKSEIVTYYNAYKSGVDNFDKLVRNYRSQRKCRRWPYGVFFNLVDASCIIAHKLWPEKETHYEFKKELGKEMCMPLIQKRSCHENLRSSVKAAMTLIGLTFLSATMEVDASRNKRGRCFMCPRFHDTKTNFACDVCHRFVCKNHRSMVKEIHCKSCLS